MLPVTTLEVLKKGLQRNRHSESVCRKALTKGNKATFCSLLFERISKALVWSQNTLWIDVTYGKGLNWQKTPTFLRDILSFPARNDRDQNANSSKSTTFIKQY